MKFNPYLDKMQGKVTIDRKTGEPFNPLNFSAKKDDSGKRKVSASERLFNKDNELNASSKKDALQKIAALFEMVQDGEFEVATQPEGFKVDAAEQDALLKQAYADPSGEGFAKLGQQMLTVVREVIDYEGVTRKLWMDRPVKAGETIRYDKDVHVVAYVIGEDGETPQSVVGGKYFFPPEFEVSANVSIELKDQYRSQYNILERAQDKARQAIEYREDLAGIRLLRRASNVVNTTVAFASMNLGAFESLRYQIEQHRLMTAAFLIHRQEVSDIVNVLTAQVDPVTQREIIMAGYIGHILNTAVITTAGTNNMYEILQPGEVFAVTLPEYLGGISQRSDLMSEPYTEAVNGKPRRGFYWWEMLCLALINAKGVAYGQKI
ncbi:MAG: HK97-fold major capsid protein [Candidatus Paceibacterota bacterium]